jgi:hypothetical protein
VTTNDANVGARRFYESHGFHGAFVTYHASRPAPGAVDSGRRRG